MAGSMYMKGRSVRKTKHSFSRHTSKERRCSVVLKEETHSFSRDVSRLTRLGPALAHKERSDKERISLKNNTIVCSVRSIQM